MAKKPNNAWLAQQQAKKDAEIRWHRAFAMQWAWDAAIIAAHTVFHRKGEKMVEFAKELERQTYEIAQMTLDDSVHDKEIWYAKGKVDAKLKEILGEENFAPWDERYDIKVG